MTPGNNHKEKKAAAKPTVSNSENGNVKSTTLKIPPASASLLELWNAALRVVMAAGWIVQLDISVLPPTKQDRDISLYLSSHSTVSDLKVVLRQQLSIPEEEQRLYLMLDTTKDNKVVKERPLLFRDLTSQLQELKKEGDANLYHFENIVLQQQAWTLQMKILLTETMRYSWGWIELDLIMSRMVVTPERGQCYHGENLVPQSVPSSRPCTICCSVSHNCGASYFCCPVRRTNARRTPIYISIYDENYDIPPGDIPIICNYLSTTKSCQMAICHRCHQSGARLRGAKHDPYRALEYYVSKDVKDVLSSGFHSHQSGCRLPFFTVPPPFAPLFLSSKRRRRIALSQRILPPGTCVKMIMSSRLQSQLKAAGADMKFLTTQVRRVFSKGASIQELLEWNHQWAIETSRETELNSLFAEKMSIRELAERNAQQMGISPSHSRCRPRRGVREQKTAITPTFLVQDVEYSLEDGLVVLHVGWYVDVS